MYTAFLAHSFLFDRLLFGNVQVDSQCSKFLCPLLSLSSDEDKSEKIFNNYYLDESLSEDKAYFLSVDFEILFLAILNGCVV